MASKVKKGQVSAAAEEKFYAEASDWEADGVLRAERSERRAWTIASVSTAVATVAVIGCAMLAPFKVTVPYLFAVDRATGNVEFVSAADDRKVVGYQELTDKHWASAYVIARENYNYRLLQRDYDTVLNLSSDDVGREYATSFTGPDARDKKLGASIEWRVKILSVTLSHDGVGTKAVVRFERTPKRVQSEIPDAPQYFVATMAFDYKPSQFGKEEVLIANPLGFKVSAYRVDAETAQPAAQAVPSNVNISMQ